MEPGSRRAEIEAKRALQQRAWMEQRQLARDTEHVMQAGGSAAAPLHAASAAGSSRAGLGDADVLNRLTERISERLRIEIKEELEREASQQKLAEPERNALAQDNVERYLSGEMASQTCPICMELMVTPRTPTMLFPCGHTFCASCLDENAAKGGSSKNKCPFCRVQIESQAPNLTLQHLVSSYADRQSAIGAGKYDEFAAAGAAETPPPQNTEPSAAARVQREYRLCEMRWSILHNERSDIGQQVQAIEGKEAAAALVLDRLSGEETRIGDRMALLHAELELVRSHQQEQRERLTTVSQVMRASKM